MTEADIRQAYDARCAVLAAHVGSLGMTLAKSASQGMHEIHVTGGGGMVAFPIVTDERDWHEMSAEAAFYGAMIDAKSWKNVRLDDVATAALDDRERVELPLIKREVGAESDRMGKFAQMLGGQSALDALLARVDAE